MKKISIGKRLLSVTLAIIFFLSTSIITNSTNLSAATKLNINLSNNQTFYILPGSDTVEYKVKITAGGNLGNNITYTSNNIAIAAIDNLGTLTLKDAGTAKITVSTETASITRTIKILVRSDWTRTASVQNADRITVKKNICTMKITNHMDFPLKMTYRYSTFSASNNTLQSDVESKPVYLPANTTISYHTYMDDDVKYVSIDDATFKYDQFGWDNINPKKITVKETILVSKKDKKVKVIKETLTNKNKKAAIIPYEAYVYDQDGKLARIDYTIITLPGGKKTSVQNTFFFKKPTLNEYTSKVKYKFLPSMPAFQTP